MYLTSCMARDNNLTMDAFEEMLNEVVECERCDTGYCQRFGECEYGTNLRETDPMDFMEYFESWVNDSLFEIEETYANYSGRKAFKVIGGIK